MSTHDEQDHLEPPPAVQAPIELVTQADERRSARRRLNVLVALLVACVVVIIATFAITVVTYRAEVDTANEERHAAEDRAAEGDRQLATLLERRTNFEEVIAASERANFCTIRVRARYDTALGDIVVTASNGLDPSPEQVEELAAAISDYDNLATLCPPPPEPNANIEGIPTPRDP